MSTTTNCNAALATFLLTRVALSLFSSLQFYVLPPTKNGEEFVVVVVVVVVDCIVAIKS